MAWSKMVGLDVSPVTDKFVDVAAKRPAFQEVSGDIVKPEALAQVREFFGCFHCIVSWVTHG